MAHLYMFEFVFGIFFIMFISIFFLTFYRILKQNKVNNNSPRLKVEAKVVDKRDHHSHSRSNGHTHTFYYYYITFEFESGDRMELSVPEYEYGLIIEGDYGYLTFQGTRFISFERR